MVGVDSDEAAAAARVARAVDFLGHHSIPARPHVVVSREPAADVLIDLSHQWQARMVVMGAHFIGELGSWLFGSATASMLKAARLPLFLYH